jgi:four helix bundle protein
MSRDHRRLRVFQQADALLLRIYKETKTFPAEERYLLQRELRRAALSVPSNIVEGCARRTTKECCRFVDISAGSLGEARYLGSVADRLGYFRPGVFDSIEREGRILAGGLETPVRSLSERAVALTSHPET